MSMCESTVDIGEAVRKLSRIEVYIMQSIPVVLLPCRQADSPSKALTLHITTRISPGNAHFPLKSQPIETMAPSAVETITVPEPVVSSTKLSGFGGNYDLLESKFHEKAEREGTGEHAPASVRIPSSGSAVAGLPHLLIVVF
jgi:hypothetical protein